VQVVQDQFDIEIEKKQCEAEIIDSFPVADLFFSIFKCY
jgi:hypothetical protein